MILRAARRCDTEAGVTGLEAASSGPSRRTSGRSPARGECRQMARETGKPSSLRHTRDNQLNSRGAIASPPVTHSPHHRKPIARITANHQLLVAAWRAQQPSKGDAIRRVRLAGVDRTDGISRCTRNCSRWGTRTTSHARMSNLAFPSPPISRVSLTLASPLSYEETSQTHLRE